MVGVRIGKLIWTSTKANQFTFQHQVITGVDNSLSSRHPAGLEVEVVVVVLQDERELNSIPEVSQPHLPAGQVRVEDPTDDLDPGLRQSLTGAVRRTVADTAED